MRSKIFQAISVGFRRYDGVFQRGLRSVLEGVRVFQDFFTHDISVAFQEI